MNGAFSQTLSQKPSFGSRRTLTGMPAAPAVAWNSTDMSIAPLNAASEADSVMSAVPRPAFLAWNAAFSGSYARCGSSLLWNGSDSGIG